MQIADSFNIYAKVELGLEGVGFCVAFHAFDLRSDLISKNSVHQGRLLYFRWNLLFIAFMFVSIKSLAMVYQFSLTQVHRVRLSGSY